IAGRLAASLSAGRTIEISGAVSATGWGAIWGTGGAVATWVMTGFIGAGASGSGGGWGAPIGLPLSYIIRAHIANRPAAPPASTPAYRRSHHDRCDLFRLARPFHARGRRGRGAAGGRIRLVPRRARRGLDPAAAPDLQQPPARPGRGP